MVCAEIRKQFGAPIEKLAWLQKFMLQDGANHFLAAVEMMKHGLAVLILTNLTSQFDMDADHAIGELLSLGYCRYDKPQSYVLLLVNPLVNKMLAALKNPMRLEISDTAYDALMDVQTARQVRDEAELAVLETMRQPNTSKFTVQMGDEEALLEIYANVKSDRTVRESQISPAHQDEDQAILTTRKIVKKVTKQKIGVVAVKLNDQSSKKACRISRLTRASSL